MWEQRSVQYTKQNKPSVNGGGESFESEEKERVQQFSHVAPSRGHYVKHATGYLIK